jgi:hypothetical protein
MDSTSAVDIPMSGLAIRPYLSISSAFLFSHSGPEGEQLKKTTTNNNPTRCVQIPRFIGYLDRLIPQKLTNKKFRSSTTYTKTPYKTSFYGSS